MKKYHKIQKSEEKQNDFSTVFFESTSLQDNRTTGQRDNKTTRQQVNRSTGQQVYKAKSRGDDKNAEDKRSLKTYNPTSSTINHQLLTINLTTTFITFITFTSFIPLNLL